jgi:hypothetical protein
MLRAREEVERAIMVCLAGGIAEARRKGHGRGLGADRDLRDAYALAFRVCADLAEAERYVAWLHARTRGLLFHVPWHWPPVRAIAAELVRKGRVSGRRARELYRRALTDATTSVVG